MNICPTDDGHRLMFGMHDTVYALQLRDFSFFFLFRFHIHMHQRHYCSLLGHQQFDCFFPLRIWWLAVVSNEHIELTGIDTNVVPIGRYVSVDVEVDRNAATGCPNCEPSQLNSDNRIDD